MANDVTASIPRARIESFRSTMRGEVLEPSNPSYDATRIVWNGMIDRRPALIARCANAADVVASVNFARDQRLAIAVRSGGHNVAGYAVREGGLMIDMSLMNAVRVAPGLDRAIVEGGAVWGDVDAAPPLRSRDAGRPHIGDRRCGPHALRRHRLVARHSRPQRRQFDGCRRRNRRWQANPRR